MTELGASVRALAPIRGTRTEADVAMLWDWHSWWAQNLEWRPSEDHDARERADAWYEGPVAARVTRRSSAGRSPSRSS